MLEGVGLIALAADLDGVDAGLDLERDGIAIDAGNLDLAAERRSGEAHRHVGDQRRTLALAMVGVAAWFVAGALR